MNLRSAMCFFGGYVFATIIFSIAGDFFISTFLIMSIPAAFFYFLYFILNIKTLDANKAKLTAWFLLTILYIVVLNFLSFGVAKKMDSMIIGKIKSGEIDYESIVDRKVITLRRAWLVRDYIIEKNGACIHLYSMPYSYAGLDHKDCFEEAR